MNGTIKIKSIKSFLYQLLFLIFTDIGCGDRPDVCSRYNRIYTKNIGEY
jgi:hypothetical protein